MIDKYTKNFKEKYFSELGDEFINEKINTYLQRILLHQDFDTIINFYDMKGTEFDEIMLTSLTKGL